jgi:hypothetical protein
VRFNPKSAVKSDHLISAAAVIELSNNLSMQGSSKTFEYSGETTEWEDILIKKNITTREQVLLSKGLNPADYIKQAEIIEEVDPEQERHDRLQKATLEELDELEEEDEEFADSRALEMYRNARLQELKAAAVKNRFGDLVEIVKDEWVREVTESSKACKVVVHLYKDSVIECNLMDECLRTLAPKFRYVKFLRIKFDQAIENWPERNLPTLFIYSEGSLQGQLITASQIGGKKMTAADVEWFLVKNKVIHDSELEEDPRSVGGSDSQVKHKLRGAQRGAYDDDDGDDSD